MKHYELLASIMEKYSEHLEMVGVESPELIIQILIHELAKEIEKNKYLEKRLQLNIVEENKECKH